MKDIIKIAIVDDEAFFTEMLTDRVRTFLQNSNIKFEIQAFTEGFALLEMCHTL